MSKIVSELMAEFTPVLGRVCEAIELANRAQGKVKENIRRAVDDAEASILPHAEAVLRQYDAFNEDLRQLGLELSAADGARSPGAAAARGKSPRPVITGATNPPKTTLRPRKGKKPPKQGRRSA